MTFKSLLDAWSAVDKPQVTRESWSVRLTAEDAARVMALEELFPGVSREQIITDLLSVALDQLQAAIPYVPGKNVIREDDFGDPVFDDAGLTPRFLELVKKHRQALEDQ